MVNNAGISGATQLLGSELHEFREVFETNYFGLLRRPAGGAGLASILAENGGGELVDISSVLAWVGGFGGYGDSKTAIWSLTNSLRSSSTSRARWSPRSTSASTDTDMTANFAVPKNDPRDVARQIVDGTRDDQAEVLADESSLRATGLRRRAARRPARGAAHRRGMATPQDWLDYRDPFGDWHRDPCDEMISAAEEAAPDSERRES